MKTLTKNNEKSYIANHENAVCTFAVGDRFSNKLMCTIYERSKTIDK